MANIGIHPAIIIASFVFMIAASISDVRERRISNKLNFSAVFVGLSLHFVFGGLDGFVFGLKGLSVGLGILLFPFVAGMMGGGDVKFAAAAGAFLGWRLLLVGLVVGVLLGGVAGAISLARQQKFKSAFRGLTADILCLAGGVKPDTLKSTAASETVPYGVHLAMGFGGTLLAAIFRWVPWVNL